MEICLSVRPMLPTGVISNSGTQVRGRGWVTTGGGMEMAVTHPRWLLEVGLARMKRKKWQYLLSGIGSSCPVFRQEMQTNELKLECYACPVPSIHVTYTTFFCGSHTRAD